MFSPTRLLTPAGKTPGRYPSLCQHPQAPSAPAPRAVPGFVPPRRFCPSTFKRPQASSPARLTPSPNPTRLVSRSLCF
ncbi:hypothetical protein HYQ44_004185 [Verticillium longisporum]|nr:hypothetical protein HYQ44_004185 [Verticillium longisporum]